MPPIQRQRLAQTSEVMAIMTGGFASVETASAEQAKVTLLHQTREGMRDKFSAMRPNSFPRYGAISISLDDIFQEAGFTRRLRFRTRPRCTFCGNPEISFNREVDLHYMFYTLSMECLGRTPQPAVSIQEWVTAQLEPRITVDDPHRCELCNNELGQLRISHSESSFPPILVFQTHHSTISRLRPSHKLALPSINTQQEEGEAIYQLFGITFHGHSHFTARIYQAEMWWSYDGMHSAPSLLEERLNLASRAEVDTMAGYTPTHFMYTLKSAHQRINYEEPSRV